jgi:hypothetical protein
MLTPVWYTGILHGMSSIRCVLGAAVCSTDVCCCRTRARMVLLELCCVVHVLLFAVGVS